MAAGIAMCVEREERSMGREESRDHLQDTLEASSRNYTHLA